MLVKKAKHYPGVPQGLMNYSDILVKYSLINCSNTACSNAKCTEYHKSEKKLFVNDLLFINFKSMLLLVELGSFAIGIF